VIGIKELAHAWLWALQPRYQKPAPHRVETQCKKLFIIFLIFF